MAKILKDIGSKLQNLFKSAYDDKGYFQQGRFTTQPLNKRIVSNPYVRKAAEGFGEASTFGLYDIKAPQSQNFGQKLAYGTGFVGGMINPLNPLNKAMGALNIGGKLVSRFAPKATGMIARKVLPGLVSEGLQTAAYTGASNLAAKAGLREKPDNSPMGIATNFGLGLGLRGAFSSLGKNIKGARVKGTVGRTPVNMEPEDTGVLDRAVGVLGFKKSPKELRINAEIAIQDLIEKYATPGEKSKAKDIRGMISLLQKKFKDSSSVSQDANIMFGLVDKGKPSQPQGVTAYHGTDANFDTFDPNKIGTNTDTGMFGKGFYFSDDIAEAKTYARKTGNVKQVTLDLKKPYVINSAKDIPKIDVPNNTLEEMKNGPKAYSEAFTKYLQDRGYDGVIDNMSKNKQYVVFDPNKIKINSSVSPQGVVPKEPIKIKSAKPVTSPQNIEEQIQQSLANDPSKVQVASKTSKKAKFVIKSGQKPPGSPSGKIIAQDKYAYNVNVNRLKLKPEEQANLRKTVEIAKPELEKIKGKTLSNDEVVKAAKTSEILQKVTPRESTMQAEAAMLKARQQMVSLDNEVTQLAKSGNTQKLRAKLTDLVESLKVVSSNAADKGRQLQALSIDAGDESIRSQVLKDILKTEKDSNKVIEGALKVNWDNADEVGRFYRAFVKPSVGQILDEFRYNNMLSSPRTHIRNAFSNMVQTFVSRPATHLAQGDFVGTAQYYTGAIKSFPTAVDEFVRSFKGESAMAKPDLNYISSYKLPKFLTIPTRAMEAADKFFTALIKGGEMRTGATEAQALKTAEYSLFREGLNPEGQGKLLNGIDSITNWMYKAPKAVRWFVPFIRTPMNFAKQWIEHSPLGIATLPGAANKKEQLAKAMIGSVVTAIGAKVALEDRTTWSAPTDPKQKEAFYASGRKPFSVKIGDNWVSMQYLGPYGLAFAMPAAFKHYQDDSRTALTDDQITKAGKSLMGMAEFFSGQTFLDGMNNFVKLASGDVDYTLPKNLAYTTGQVIPLQGLVRWVSTVVDDVYRKPKGFTEQLQSGIPFASQGLESYTMPNGETSKREQRNLLTPYDITTSRPEFEPMLQGRTEKLQNNAVKNQLEKDAQSGMTPPPDSAKYDVEQAKVMFEFSPEATKLVGSTLLYKDDKGKVQEIDTAFQPTPPDLTGNESLDARLTSRYKSEITKKEKEIETLYDQKFLTAEEANKQLMELDGIKESLKKPKKAKKPKAIKIASAKISKATNVKFKLSKPPKAKKTKAYTISKSKQPKQAKFKLAKTKIRLSPKFKIA